MNGRIEQMSEIREHYWEIASVYQDLAVVHARALSARTVKDNVVASVVDAKRLVDEVILEYHNKVIVHSYDLGSFVDKYCQGVDVDEPMPDSCATVITNNLKKKATFWERLFYMNSADGLIRNGVVGIVNAGRVVQISDEYPVFDKRFLGRPVRLSDRPEHRMRKKDGENAMAGVVLL